MSSPHELDAGLGSLARLLEESRSADQLMKKALSPFKLSLQQLLLLKRLEDGEKSPADLATRLNVPVKELTEQVRRLDSQGFLSHSAGRCRLTALGLRVLESKWEEVERLKRYMTDRISSLTLDSVGALLADLNGGYFQGLD